MPNKMLAGGLCLKPMKYIREDINDNNNSSYCNQNTNYSSRNTEEKPQEPDDKNQDDNSPQYVMKHGDNSFSNEIFECK